MLGRLGQGKGETMKSLWIAVIVSLAVFMLGATLERKKTEAWGTVEPCTQAIEDIAAEVNERLGEQ